MYLHLAKPLCFSDNLCCPLASLFQRPADIIQTTGAKKWKEQRFNNSHVSRFECHDWLRHGNPLEPSTAVSRMTSTGRLADTKATILNFSMFRVQRYSAMARVTPASVAQRIWQSFRECEGWKVFIQQQCIKVS